MAWTEGAREGWSVFLSVEGPPIITPGEAIFVAILIAVMSTASILFINVYLPINAESVRKGQGIGPPRLSKLWSEY